MSMTIKLGQMILLLMPNKYIFGEVSYEFVGCPNAAAMNSMIQDCITTLYGYRFVVVGIVDGSSTTRFGKYK